MDKYAGSMSVWAYEILGRWIVMNEDGQVLDSHEDNDFATVIDFWRRLGYDVIITTDESWKALADV
jgi:hypothetical protein